MIIEREKYITKGLTRRIYSLFTILIALSLIPINTEAKTKILLKTDKGDIKIVLFDETPKHRDNFIKLVKEGYFDGTLFHRVIKDFMIQGGDPDSREATPGQLLGEGGPAYALEAEFRTPKIYHVRGMLAAAREGDSVNPKRASSGSQFYIVWGKKFDDSGLDAIQKRIDDKTQGKVKLTKKMRKQYKKIGGTPHLDGQYTIFGKVISGLEVVEAIQQSTTDKNDRPVDDIHLITATIL
jgi:cyclophilin family peptidyl-prolyl cis-trans isomerase